MGQAVLRSQNGISASLPTPSQLSTGCVQMCPSFLNTHKIFLNLWAAPYLMQAIVLLLCVLLWSWYKIPLKDGLVTEQNPGHAWRNPPDGWRNLCSTKCSAVIHCASSLGFIASHIGSQLCYPHRIMALPHHRCCRSYVWWWHLGDTNVYLGQTPAAASFFCFSLTQALCIGPAMIWTSRVGQTSQNWEGGLRLDKTNRSRAMENLSHGMGCLDLACLV